ncbi:MAG: secretion protein HlyD [Alphaproteobacteria bacterium]|nr:secretion protein HlyD [Alphaproteobacteria bacterium]
MKSRIVVIALALLAGGAAAAWQFAPLGIMRGPAERGLTLYGNVDIRQVELGFRVAGRIADMPFEEGDPIKAGQRMAALDQRPYKDALRLAEADVAAARATLHKMEGGTRPEEVAQARSLVEQRSASLNSAKATFERRAALLKTGAGSRQAYDDAERAMKEAEAQFESAKEALALSLKGFREEDIAVARASLQSAEARADATRTSLADTEILAPADGTILARVREPGAIVATGATVYTLSLDRPIWVRAYVGEPDLGRIRPGMKAQVFTDTRPDRPYDGQIGFISPVAEFTPKSVETVDLRSDLVYRLRVIVPAGDSGLRQGMPVTVRLVAE